MSTPHPHVSNWRAIALILAVLLGVAAALTGITRTAENAISAVNAALLRRPASGELRIVEIDARSIAAIDTWPWSRSQYAKLVDQLRQAGAASIAFDIDFSSRADKRDDDAFGDALARAGGGVILPTFRQRAGGGNAGWVDSLPVPILRDHASLAAVSILPDKDGLVRRAPIATITRGLPRPSLSAMLADVASGAVDADFAIDFAIDPETIPRSSFIDIRDGRFDPKDIEGKRVLVGATAIEMGDRYAVPNYGVIPGVVIQAVAAETLRNGVPTNGGWVLPLLAASLFAWLVMRARRNGALLAASLAAPASLFGLAVAARSLLAIRFAIVPGLIALTFIIGAAYTMRAVTAARRRRLEDHDTGLPNRHAMRSTLVLDAGTGIVAARFSDFDKLGTSLGTTAAVDLIRRVSERIAMVTAGEPLFRIEDRVIAWRCLDEAQVEESLATVRAMMLNPIEVQGRRVDVQLALGFAPTLPGETTDHTIARAMLAADHALTQGQSWHVDDGLGDAAADLELSLLGELDEAIRQGQLDVFYQPKLCLRTDAITSVEALVRWTHPTRGMLRPDLFIPIAERNDRIAGMTLYVLECTIRDLRAWQAQGYAINAAVNLSAKLLNSVPFLAELRRLVETSGIAPNELTFEITESAAMTNPEEAAMALRSFQAMGIAISIDDYGTGQSTLSYLKQLPFNELKIDRSFVQFAHQNRSDAVLVQSTIDLAHGLGLKVVAEGVEDYECLAFLRAVGCDMAQGYLISRPVPFAEVFSVLNDPLRYAA